jgi:hypothetical protein
VKRKIARTTFTARQRRQIAHDAAQQQMIEEMNAPNQSQRANAGANADQDSN